MAVRQLWRWARAQARRAMAPRPQHQNEWGWLRNLGTNKDYYIYVYQKLRAGWPAPQPRPIQPEVPEPWLPIVFVEPSFVPDLAYDTPTTTTTPVPPDEDALLPSPPASFKTITVPGLLGLAGLFICLANFLRAKAKEARAARRRLRHLQGGWLAVAAEGMLPPPLPPIGQ